MLTISLSQIFSTENLRRAFEHISHTTKGLDEIDYTKFSQNLKSNLTKLQTQILSHTYAPEPLRQIKIPKDNGKFRPLGLASTKDKTVQMCLYNAIFAYFDKLFCSNSYAYRPGKSAKTAINRTSDFIKNSKVWIFKSDIKDFFENINHEKLLALLASHIGDKALLNLIDLFIKNGIFSHGEYHAHSIGVHQGDILSPLFSNIFLNQMDQFILSQNIDFVRYADDFVALFNKKQEAINFEASLKDFLKSIDLELNLEKTKILHISEKFTFLGVEFCQNHRTISQKSLDKIIKSLNQISKFKNSEQIANKLNEILLNLKNYYFKILPPNSTQITQIREIFIKHLTDILKQQNDKKLLKMINLSAIFEPNSTPNFTALAFRQKTTTQKLNAKKQEYSKKIANDQTLHLATSGLFLGVAKNTFVIKSKGVIQKQIPIEKVKRIIVEASISLSQALIRKAVNRGIVIDFIDRDLTPYATLISSRSALPQNYYRQAKLIGSPKALKIATCFIKAKATNSLNYLKYLSRNHDLGIDLTQIKLIIDTKIPKAQSTDELMGYEGVISAFYWQGIKAVLNTKFETRVTYGAKDLVNSSLNYAYAILYGVVQRYLFEAGLSLNISFLHAPQKLKPTLSYDMIEEFRAFVVDRTIVAMLNKGEPLKLDNDGLLDNSSRQLIAKNIKEKLGSYTKWHKQNHKIENIISHQCHALARAVFDGEKYRPFIGKY